MFEFIAAIILLPFLLALWVIELIIGIIVFCVRVIFFMIASLIAFVVAIFKL